MKAKKKFKIIVIVILKERDYKRDILHSSTIITNCINKIWLN
jgi:hypothetical protein